VARGATQQSHCLTAIDARADGTFSAQAHLNATAPPGARAAQIDGVGNLSVRHSNRGRFRAIRRLSPGK
jgi:hypothetical protein